MKILIKLHPKLDRIDPKFEHWHRFWIVRVTPLKISGGGSRPMRSLDSRLSTNHRPPFQANFILWLILKAATVLQFSQSKPDGNWLGLMDSVVCYLTTTWLPLAFHLPNTWRPLDCQLTSTWLPLECHLTTTWLPLAFHLPTTWGPLDCQLTSTWLPLECHLTANWLPLDYHLTATWLPLDYHLTTTWLPLDYHLSTTWVPLNFHLTTTWLPLDYFLTTTWGKKKKGPKLRPVIGRELRIKASHWSRASSENIQRRDPYGPESEPLPGVFFTTNPISLDNI